MTAIFLVLGPLSKRCALQALQEKRCTLLQLIAFSLNIDSFKVHKQMSTTLGVDHLTSNARSTHGRQLWHHFLCLLLHEDRVSHNSFHLGHSQALLPSHLSDEHACLIASILAVCLPRTVFHCVCTS